MPDVIIIGAGIAGCSTAWHLAAAGVDVLVLERGEVNGQASGANAGSLHAQIQHEPFVGRGADWARGFSPALAFYRYAIDTWEQAAGELRADLEFARDGGIIVAATADQMRHIEAKSRLEQAAGLGTRLLDRAALRSIAPYVSDEMIGGAYCPLEGKASPLRATPAFAAAAEDQGARICCHCEVTGIRRDGPRYTVETSRGSHSAARIVNAAGIDTGRVAGLVGAALEISAFPIQLTVTEPVAPLISHLVYSAEDMLTLKQTRAGTLLIGGGWPATLDSAGRPQVRAESLSRNLALAIQVVPRVANAIIVRSWAAIVNGNDSWLPILGEMPGSPGFFIAYVPWMGFTGGPAAGRIVASLVMGHTPPVDFDIGPFSP